MDETKNNSLLSMKIDKKTSFNLDSGAENADTTIERKKLDTIIFNNKLKYIKLNQPKINHPLKNITFFNNSDKALFLFSKSGFLQEKASFFLNLNHKRNAKLYKQTSTVLIESLASVGTKKANFLEERLKTYMNDNETKELVINGFIPSKTAQNGLNFISTTDEKNLANTTQPNEIINIFKIMFLMMNEPLHNLNEQDLIKHLMTRIYPRVGIDNIKSLFLQCIVKIDYFSQEQLDKLNALTGNNPKVFFSGELLKVNKTVSFFSFFLKEFYDYCMSKSFDGTYIFKIRKIYSRMNHLNQRAEFLRSKLALKI